MTNVRTIYNPVFESGGVDLVLAGHSHTYERSMLIDGHYGIASTLAPENVLDGGDGDPLGDGPYTKPSAGPTAHAGTVYVVNGVGENARADGGALDHPVMISAFAFEGSMVIDVDGNRLEAHFISRLGDVLDHFEIVKADFLPSIRLPGSIVLVSGLAGLTWLAARRREEL